jgi:hypothetical protein
MYRFILIGLLQEVTIQEMLKKWAERLKEWIMIYKE